MFAIANEAKIVSRRAVKPFVGALTIQVFLGIVKVEGWAAMA